jgi:hypothetical protein
MNDGEKETEIAFDRDWYARSRRAARNIFVWPECKNNKNLNISLKHVERCTKSNDRVFTRTHAPQKLKNSKALR